MVRLKEQTEENERFLKMLKQARIGTIEKLQIRYRESVEGSKKDPDNELFQARQDGRQVEILHSIALLLSATERIKLGKAKDYKTFLLSKKRLTA